MKRLVVPSKTVRLNEWQTVMEPSLRLTDVDRKLVNQLAREGGERCLIVEELREGLRIEARSWVGVVRFTEFEVCVGCALLLAEACSALVKWGLQSDYVVREDVLPVLRGRLLADRQLMQHFGRVDLLECRYDEYETDIPENQLLAAALELCAQRVKDDLVRRRVRHLLVAFKQVCDPFTLNVSLLRQTLSYTRLNEQYRNAHALAWLILDGLGISDLLYSGTAGSFVFLIDMNRLFEQFLWRVLNTLCSRNNLRVRYQLKNRSVLWNGLKNKPYSNIIPDFLVDLPSASSETKSCLPVDAKYKLYDELKVGNADIYQCFLYAFAYEQSQSSGLPKALMLYPGTKDVPSENVVEIRNMSSTILGPVYAMSVPIPALLEEMTNNVQGVVSNKIVARIKDAIHQA